MFQFPVNPVLDQKFSPSGGPTYKWNGTGWIPFTLLFNGGLTFTGPVLFADGTLAEPGIAWANQPGMGIWRVGQSHMQAVIGGAAIWGMNATTFALGTGVNFSATTATFGGVINANAGVYLPVGGSINSPGGELLHAGGDNRIHLGRVGYAETIINSSGTNRVHVHAGGTAFTGTVTGITAGMVGLGSVLNTQQVMNYAPQNGALYMAWDGAHILGQYGGTNFGSWWPIDVTGAARAMWTPQGVTMNFNWVGLGGTPAWLWGTAGDASIYLYNPANFTVNYAHGAGNANRAAYVSNAANHASTGFVFHWHDPGNHPSYVWGSVDGTTMYVYPPGRLNVNNANYSGNSGQVNGIGGWSYSNVDNNPVWLWGSNGNTQHQFLAHRASLSVNYANSSGYANSAGNANTLGGVGAGNFVRNNQGTISNMRIWEDGNGWIWLEVSATGNFGAVGNTPTFSQAVNLFRYGPTSDERFAVLEARLAALEAH